MTRIVVGIDGSEASQNALRWALEEAQFHQGARLTVVHAYHLPASRNYSAYADSFLNVSAMVQRIEVDQPRREFDQPPREDDETYVRQGAKRLLNRVLDAARTGPISGKVELLAIPDDPAKTLIDFSRDADMVVVGSRGRGGFKGLLLGSVSQQCLHHAHCPVVVVR